MSDYLPREVREGLELARKRDLRRKNRLRVHVGDKVFPIHRFWDGGFALDLENAPNLRGLVDIYDGGRQLYSCLIVASEATEHEMTYDFKWHRNADEVRPLDYYLEPDAPAGLLTRQ